ncbi:MAG: transglutaminase-like domain-containing protein [Desulfotignum sp.]|nr:transglutaminase-like domain-containing protein [Desulfotignum sp.]
MNKLHHIIKKTASHKALFLNVTNGLILLVLLLLLGSFLFSAFFLKQQIFSQSSVQNTLQTDEFNWNINQIRIDVISVNTDQGQVVLNFSNNIPFLQRLKMKIDQNGSTVREWRDVDEGRFSLDIEKGENVLSIYGINQYGRLTNKAELAISYDGNHLEMNNASGHIINPSYRFVFQSPDNVKRLHFKSIIELALPKKLNEMDEIVAIRKWVRNLQGPFSKEMWQNTPKTDDPLKALAEMQKKTPGLCRRFAVVLHGAFLSVGIPVRLVFATPDFYSHSYNHSLVEVWSQTLNKWILVDATMDTLYMIDNQPAGLLEFSRAVRNQEWEKISFERNGSDHLPEPRIFKEGTLELSPFIKSFNHIFAAKSNALFDGYQVSLFSKKRIHFVHYHEKDMARFPEGKRKLGWISFVFSGIGLLFGSIFLMIRICYLKNTIQKNILWNP